MLAKLHTCTGHRAALYALAPGRDERHFLSAGGDGWIVEWNLDDPETGQVIATVDGQIFALCVLPDGRIIAGDMNGSLYWINRDKPDATRHIQFHKKGVYALLALAGQLLSGGGDGLLTRWDTQTLRPLESYQLSNKSIRCIDWAPRRSELAIGAGDGHIYLLDAVTLEIRRILENAHSNSVFTVRYCPDERQLLSGGRDARLQAWDPDSGECRYDQPAHWYTINDIAFSPDGSRFATASRDKTMRIWSADPIRPLQTINTISFGCHINSVNRLMWLPDCLLSASDDRSVMVWGGGWAVGRLGG
jgi:WD40 repeat protein